MSASTMECSVAVEEEIQERMEQFLRSRLLTASPLMQCSFKEGMLVIRGNVGSYYVKQLAQEYARQIPGVEQVANHLKVQKSDRNELE